MTEKEKGEEISCEGQHFETKCEAETELKRVGEACAADYPPTQPARLSAGSANSAGRERGAKQKGREDGGGQKEAEGDRVGMKKI